MRLVLNGAVFCISQMGPNDLFVESLVDHPRGRAIIEIQVDDSQ